MSNMLQIKHQLRYIMVKGTYLPAYLRDIPIFQHNRKGKTDALTPKKPENKNLIVMQEMIQAKDKTFHPSQVGSGI